jgi:uncharacterized membrane protein
MYLDNTHTSRTGFRYTYKAEEMLPHAEDRLREKIDEERDAREEVISLTRDPSVNPQDRRVEEAKRRVVTAATAVEELSVYVHEFGRQPDREYNLSLGDVVFFGLIRPDIRAAVEAGIKPTN